MAISEFQFKGKPVATDISLCGEYSDEAFNGLLYSFATYQDMRRYYLELEEEAVRQIGDDHSYIRRKNKDAHKKWCESTAKRLIDSGQYVVIKIGSYEEIVPCVCDEREIDHGFVYVITDMKFVKIGKAKDFEKRLASLQTGSAEKLIPLFVFETDYMSDTEKAFHHHYRSKHVRGEWYDLMDSFGLGYKSYLEAMSGMFSINLFADRINEKGVFIRDGSETI